MPYDDNSELSYTANNVLAAMHSPILNQTNNILAAALSPNLHHNRYPSHSALTNPKPQLMSLIVGPYADNSELSYITNNVLAAAHSAILHHPQLWNPMENIQEM